MTTVTYEQLYGGQSPAGVRQDQVRVEVPYEEVSIEAVLCNNCQRYIFPSSTLSLREIAAKPALYVSLTLEEAMEQNIPVNTCPISIVDHVDHCGACNGS